MSSEITGIESRLLPIVRLFCPELGDLSGDDLTVRMADTLGFLYGAPVALAGLVWLIAATDLAVVRTHWPTLLLLLGLVILLKQLTFTFSMRIAWRRYASAEGTLAGILSWSAALSFGTTALWLSVAGVLGQHLRRSLRVSRKPVSASTRWNRARDLSFELGEITAGLIALALYRRWGGAFPPTDLTLPGIGPAALATVARLLLSQFLLLPFLVYLSRVFKERPVEYRLGRYVATVMALRGLIEPFALLAVVLYAAAGLGGYLFFAAGVFLASLLARQLSRAALRSHQHAWELEKLEQLGQAIIRTPVTPSSLSEVLREHVPDMFPNFQIDVRLFPGRSIYRHPEDQTPVAQPAWDWLRTAGKARYFSPGETLPGGGQLTEHAVVLAPVFEPDNTEPVGGIAVVEQVHSPWSIEDLVDSLSAIQTLAGQIGSALHGAQLYRMEQELALAGQIQASFLPDQLPDIPGWQVTAALQPARQTAGDFYDVIPLPNGRFGLVVADVADKGMGAALYMALSRTLLRTYALEYHARPDWVMRITNRRLLMDTDVTMFVTLFYGTLDPETGELTYCNAGHNAPLLLRDQGRGPVQTLPKTGMALGAVPGKSWERAVVQFLPGDLLVLYSDGVTDAQDEQGIFFGQDRLLEAILANAGSSASRVQDGLLRAVLDFTGDAAQFDDVTLMVVTRDA